MLTLCLHSQLLRPSQCQAALQSVSQSVTSQTPESLLSPSPPEREAQNDHATGGSGQQEVLLLVLQLSRRHGGAN